jgi:hypothetical protein
VKNRLIVTQPVKATLTPTLSLKKEREYFLLLCR